MEDDYNCFIGEIRAFAFNRIPNGWTPCNGQLLSVPENNALFSLLGATYGGNGNTTFALPDLRGRAILHSGTYEVSPYHISYQRGQSLGSEDVLLNTDKVPAHTHSFQVVNARGTSALDPAAPGASYLAAIPEVPQILNENINAFINQVSVPAGLDIGTIGTAGGNSGHENRMPYLPVLLCIATKGYFPPRD